MEIKSKLILKYAETEGDYVEQEIETGLLKIFKSKNPKKKVDQMLTGNDHWHFRYHLSPVRQNLLAWYPFKKTENLLEVGCGCGALTGLFCKRLNKVTAIELTKQRATITSFRHKDKNNLSVIAGNFEKIDIKERFDYVTCLGVLEYAGLYSKKKEPFEEFLKKLKSHLKKEGLLILAIENKFGLKYWAGSNEDHSGKIFESIEGYKGGGATTFSKTELKRMLKNAGFKQTDFFYPLPDYKFPTEIFSDHYLPTKNHNIRPGVYPFAETSWQREYFFDEKLASDNLVLSGDFDFFANSFLIFAKA